MTHQDLKNPLGLSRETQHQIASALGFPGELPTALAMAVALNLGRALHNVNKIERKSLITQLRNLAQGTRALGQDAIYEAHAFMYELAAASLQDVSPEEHAVEKLLLSRRQRPSSSTH